MSSGNEPPSSQPSQSPELRSSAGPSPTTRPLNLTQGLYPTSQLQADADTRELAGPRHWLVTNPDGTVTITPRSIHSPRFRSLPLRPNTAFRTPSEAVQALNDVREGERRATAWAAANGRPTTRGRSPLRTHSPTFPYRRYEQMPVSLPTSSENEAQDWFNTEVDAFPESQRLHEDSPTKCGRCFAVLRGGNDLPSRCQECRVVNIGDDWAANERFAQAEGRTRPQHQIREAPNHLPPGLTYLDWQRMLRENPHGATDPNYRNALLQSDDLRAEQQQADDLPEYEDQNIDDGNLLSAPPFPAFQSRNQTSVTSQNQIGSTIAWSDLPEPQLHNLQPEIVTRTSAQPHPQIAVPPTMDAIPTSSNLAPQSINQTSLTGQNQVDSVAALTNLPVPQLHNSQTGTVTRTSAQPHPQTATLPAANPFSTGFNPALQNRNQTSLTGQNQVESAAALTNLPVPQLHNSQTGNVTRTRAQPRSRGQPRSPTIDPAEANILPAGFNPYANFSNMSPGHVESRVDASLQRSAPAPPTQQQLPRQQQPSRTMSNTYANPLNMPPDHVEGSVDASLQASEPAPPTQQQLPWQQQPSRTVAAATATAHNRPYVDPRRAYSIVQDESVGVTAEAYPYNAFRGAHWNQQEAFLAEVMDRMNNDPYFSDDGRKTPISRPAFPLQPRMPAGPTIPTNTVEPTNQSRDFADPNLRSIYPWLPPGRTAPTGTQFIGRSGRAEDEIRALRASMLPMITVPRRGPPSAFIAYGRHRNEREAMRVGARPSVQNPQQGQGLGFQSGGQASGAQDQFPQFGGQATRRDAGVAVGAGDERQTRIARRDAALARLDEEEAEEERREREGVGGDQGGEMEGEEGGEMEGEEEGEGGDEDEDMEDEDDDDNDDSGDFLP